MTLYPFLPGRVFFLKIHISNLLSDPTRSTVVIWVKIFKTEKTIEIYLVRLTEVCSKVLSEKYAYKSVKTALLLSNVIMRTTKTAVCLQTKSIFHYFYGF